MTRTARLALLLLACMSITACSKKPEEGKGSKKQSSSSASDSKGGSQGGDDKSKAAGSPDEVKIESADQGKAGISVANVDVMSLPQLLTLNGQVAMDEQHTSHVGVVADGRITALNVLPGAAVRRGTVLGTLHSHSVHETVGALQQAFAAAERARSAIAFTTQARDRYAKLYDIQAASLEEKQRAEQDLAQAKQSQLDAQANVHMEREHLSELLQVSPESLTPNTLLDRELVPIRSPIDGVVTARLVTVGQVVDTGTEAFTVSNLSTVWVMAAASEKDIAFLHNGAAADVTTQGFPDVAFAGRVAMIGDTLDPQNRTLPVRLVIPNRGDRLRPGMFAAAHIAGKATRMAISIPEDALQNINGNQVVFVTPDGVTFHPQVVQLGTRSQGRVEVTDGLKPGDRIVVSGAFMVKGELLKGTVGDG